MEQSVRKFCKSIESWWRQPINPIFLEFRDPKLRDSFDEYEYNHMYKILKIVAVIFLLASCYIVYLTIFEQIRIDLIITASVFGALLASMLILARLVSKRFLYLFGPI